MSILGLMYRDGEGVPKDSAQAVRWFREAADYSVDARLHLGEEYIRGLGVPMDLVQGYMWLNLAAADGNEEAMRARDALEKEMTAAQVFEAQKLSREWRPKSGCIRWATPIG